MIVARSNVRTRALVATLAVALVLQPLAAAAAAITETLAEVPIQGLNPVKPNIVFTMDDSGSMGWDFLPDYVAWVASGIAHCRDGGQCGGATSQPGSGYAFSQYDPPIRSASYNGVFYDASATYRAGKTSTIGWFVGQVMKKTGGKANPQVVNDLLKKTLEQG